LTLIFQELTRSDATLWIPSDVYPVYLELARAAGIEPRLFTTLPEPKIPANQPTGSPEYLLITNPWKPLGRFLTDKECDALTSWLAASPRRHLLVDCVYDLSTPFHVTTQRLHGTGRAILLHSATKGWLWPKTFGVALLGKGHSQFESAFRDDSPAPDQLRLAQQFLSTDANSPSQVIAALQSRAQKMFAMLPDSVRKSLVLDPACLAPSCYFFPVGIRAEELLRLHRLLAIPASAFGADWDGSILTSLASVFAPMKSGGVQ
jgi:aspartate/methionine/tyrosine aminotransferase